MSVQIERHAVGATALQWPHDESRGTELVIDYASARVKFEGGEFRGLVFRLLRDNNKSGCPLFSESLAEKSFRHDNLPFFWGYSSLGRQATR